MAKFDSSKVLSPTINKSVSLCKKLSNYVGFVIIDNCTTLFAVLTGPPSERSPSILEEIRVNPPSRRNIDNITHSGNTVKSNLNLQQIQAEWRRHYIQQVTETAHHLFLRPRPHGQTGSSSSSSHHEKEMSRHKDICGLIIAGCGDYKDLVKNKLDPRLRSQLLNVTPISTGGAVGLREVVSICSTCIADALNEADTAMLSLWLRHMNTKGASSNPYCVGMQECEKAMQQGAVRELLVSKSALKDILRCEWMPKKQQQQSKNDFSISFVKNSVDSSPMGSSEDNFAGYVLKRKVPALSWLRKHCKENGIPIQWILGNGSEVESFAAGFGGIIGKLWFALES